jgi:hypothetical protein
MPDMCQRAVFHERGALTVATVRRLVSKQKAETFKCLKRLIAGMEIVVELI